MTKLKLIAQIMLTLSLITSCGADSKNSNEPEKVVLEEVEPFAQNQKLGLGINLGNALEAPNEGDWGVKIESFFFAEIKNAGFNSVRIPTKWSGHISETAPYTIEKSFAERIDWVVKQALNNKLMVVLNIHHFEEYMTDYNGQQEKFLAIWRQIAERYKNYSHDLIFELLNEPTNTVPSSVWNEYLAQAIAVIRETNPGRTLMVGPVDWNSVNSIQSLRIPVSETNIIASFHYYSPFQFTHQGAEWVDGSNAWLGTTWTNTETQRQAVISDFNLAKNWSQQYNIPVNVGEFGSYNKADINSRYFWTIFVSELAKQYDFSRMYWEFCSGFGVYDLNSRKWNAPLMKALNPAFNP